MKQQNGTEFKENGSTGTYNKIGDQSGSWSNAWCAVWSAPEMRRNTRGGVIRRSPRNQFFG